MIIINLPLQKVTATQLFQSCSINTFIVIFQLPKTKKKQILTNQNPKSNIDKHTKKKNLLCVLTVVKAVLR